MPIIKTGLLGFSLSEPIHHYLESNHSHLYTFDDATANSFVLKLLKRRLTVVPRPVYKIASIFGLTSNFRDEQYFDIYGLKELNPPIFSFTQEELEEGFSFLSKFGDKFVCLSTRDRNFHEHTKFENDHRNVNPESYRLAVMHLCENGYHVFRMGSKEDIGVTHPLFVDYVNQFRSDFLDIFLCAHCSFFVGDSGGLVSVARAFKRPVVMTNWIPIGLVNTASSDDLIIFKRLKKHGSYLSLKEHLSSEIAVYTDTSQYKDLQIVDNTAEEIREVVDQMIKKPEQEDQSWFWDSCLFLREPIRAKIGREFLRSLHGS